MENLNQDEFIIRPGVIAGEECQLFFPSHLGVSWTRRNLNFRSTIQNSKGENISLGYSKFMNWGEKPDLYPDPTHFKDWAIEDKCDGSLIICSKYRDELIVRTRGTFSVSAHETADEIMGLIRHRNIDQHSLLNQGYSLLFEHTSPNLPIVIHYTEPKLTLLDIIRHEDYFYMPKSFRDDVAKELGVARPECFKFDSIEEIVKACEALKGREGFVLSYNNNQNRVKLKGHEYLCLHRMKSEIGSLDKVIDLYFILGCPHYEEFKNHINSKFDFEIFSLCENHVLKICDGMKEVDGILAEMKEFVVSLANISRKEAAKKIIQTYSDMNRSHLAFSMLSGKALKDGDYKKLLFQILKD